MTKPFNKKLIPEELFGAKKQGILPGFEDGCYEAKRIVNAQTDPQLFDSQFSDELPKRDSRVSIRVSSHDLQQVQREAMKQGVPTQSLLAEVFHEYASHLTPSSPQAPEIPQISSESEGDASIQTKAVIPQVKKGRKQPSQD